MLPRVLHLSFPVSAVYFPPGLIVMAISVYPFVVMTVSVYRFTRHGCVCIPLSRHGCVCVPLSCYGRVPTPCVTLLPLSPRSLLTSISLFLSLDPLLSPPLSSSTPPPPPPRPYRSGPAPPLPSRVPIGLVQQTPPLPPVPIGLVQQTPPYPLCPYGSGPDSHPSSCPQWPPQGPRRLPVLSCPDTHRFNLFQWCFTSTETIRLIRDGEPWMATSTFTQLLSSDEDTHLLPWCFTFTETVWLIRDGISIIVSKHGPQKP